MLYRKSIWVVFGTLFLSLLGTQRIHGHLISRGVFPSGFVASRQPLPDLYEASISELQEGLEKGLFTSVDLVKVSTDIPPRAP